MLQGDDGLGYATGRPPVREEERGVRAPLARLEQRLRLLAGVSRTLASVPDVDAALRGVARLLVPAVADRCRIEAPTAGGGSRHVAEPAVHASPGAHHGPPLRVPLVLRGAELGALELARGPDGCPFDDDDRAVAEDVAHRLALAVANEQLVELAREADASRSRFLATVSHELRTPLQVVIGYADLLDSGIPVALPEPARAQVGHIGRAAAHLHEIVDQILGYARIDAGRERLRLGRVDAGELARQAALLVEPLVRRKRLRLALNVPDDPRLALETDAVKLRQILYNLLSNAVKFTDEGWVSLAVAPDEDADAIRFVVRDTGVGMTEAQFARAFELFWQAERFAGTGIAPRGGTGLGLTISRELARLLGGDLAGRAAPGGGCEFTLTVPATPPGGTSEQPGDGCE